MNSLELEAKLFFHTYKRLPIEIDRGEGVYLFSNDGKQYLDMFAGLAVNALGYCHPKVLTAIDNQIRKYIHLSNYYLQEQQLKLAELLTKYTGYSKVFLANSGTETIEGIIKISRKWGKQKGKTEIVSFSNAFHGRSMGALSLMDRPSYRNGYEPFLENFHILEFNNINQLRQNVNQKTLAVVLEFIQGEGGIMPVSQEFVLEIIALQEKFGFLLIADEIQAGVGRTGKFFGYQHFNIFPDLIAVAKPIGGGLPLGVILGNEKVSEVLEYGMHGTTFGGNPVACAAGVVVLEEIMENGLLQNAIVMGELFKSKLIELKDEFSLKIKAVRGIGLMLGIELAFEGDPIVAAMREKGVLVNCTNQNVIRFLPPLIINEQHINYTIENLRAVIGLYNP